MGNCFGRVAIVIFGLIFMAVASASAQQKEVSGTVIDGSTGKPLPGTNILVVGTTNGTITNKMGHYSLNVSSLQDTLRFSFIGYRTKKIPINGRGTVNVRLKTTVFSGKKLVVVAYGEKKKRDLSSAISTLSGNKISSIPTSSVNDALGGKIPGLIVTSTSGAPGAKSQISIRGGGTPLFVIDGVIRSKNDFENLNPNDIKTFSVLKDAAATALYGAKGGNGVILVTTKRGKPHELSINYSFDEVFTQPTVLPDKMGSYKHLLAVNKVYKAEGKTLPTPHKRLMLYKNQTKPFLYPNTDWQSLFLKNFGHSQKHQLSVSSGSEKLTYYASGSYFHQGSILKTDHNYSNRITYRLNTVSHFDKIGLSVKTDLDGFVTKNVIPNSSTASSYFQLFSHIQDKAPMDLAYNQFGLPSAQTTDNPAVGLSPLSGYNRQKSRVFNSILTLKWMVPFIPGLSFKGRGDYNMWNSMGKSWSATAPSYNNNSKVPIPGNPPSLSSQWGSGRTFTLQGFVTYKHDFGKHHLGLTGVYEQSQNHSSSLFASRQHYQIIYDQFNAGPTKNQVGSGSEAESARASFLGRLSYNYNSKYLLSATFRYDGLDLFPPGKRWGLFYAFSGGWIISSEKFFQHLKDRHILDYLKIRASTGLTGSVEGIGRFQYVPGYIINSNVWVVDGQEVQGTSEPGTLPSTNFSWFSIRSFDIGIDFATLNSRLSGSVDYYYKRTTGYVGSATRYAATLGIGLPPINLKDAALRRAGTEFGLSWKDQTGDFSYRVGINFTYTKKLWEKYPPEDKAALKNPYTRVSGKTDAAFGLGYHTLGFYQKNSDLMEGPRRISSVNVVAGDLKYADTNGDGKIDGDDFRRIGSNTFPRINYGFNFSVGYKGFYLNGTIMGSGSRDRYLGNVIQGSSAQGKLVYAFQRNYWRPNNRDALFPRAVSSGGVNGNNNFVTSDFWLLKSAYIRLKQLQLGYSFTDEILNNSPIQGLKIFISGTNIFTFSKSLNYFIDPESNPNNYNYPIQRTVSFGINIEF